MATAQINARIDSEAKALGDRGLESIGYTPTNAIRALWKYVGENLHDPKKLRALFEQLEGNSPQKKTEKEILEEVEEGPLIYERALREMGIVAIEPFDTPYEELLEQALIEKMAERGTWS